MTHFFDALLPGIRDARTPLICGLIWLLGLWLVLAGDIPNRENASGFFSQAYYVAEKVGSTTAITAVGVLAYIVGILGVSIATIVARVVGPFFVWGGTAATGVRNWFGWQSRAKRARAAFQNRVEASKADLDKAIGSDRENTARANHADVVHQLHAITDSQQMLGLIIRRTPEVVTPSMPREGSQGLSPERVRQLHKLADEMLAYDAVEALEPGAVK